MYSVCSAILDKLITWRRLFKATNPAFSFSVKVASNSLFGAMGFTGSPLYSPLASASVPLVGGWCLSLTMALMTTMGLKVVYGDTDSCFVTLPDDALIMATTARRKKITSIINDVLTILGLL